MSAIDLPASAPRGALRSANETELKMFEATDIYGKRVTVVRIVGNVAYLADSTLAHVTKIFVGGQPLGPRE
jgi:hypothetical protein